MNDDRYGLLVSALCGVVGLLIWTGFDTHAIIVESVLHSVNQRDPNAAGPYDGYYGIAVMNVFYMLSNLVVPSFANYMRSKWLMAISALLCITYYLMFTLLNRYLFFLGNALLGFAFAFFNTGQCLYVAEVSTKKTLDRNQPFLYAILSLSIFFAGVLYIVVTSASSTAGVELKYREYSNQDIYYFFGSLACAASVCLVVCSLLPTRVVANSIASGKTKNLTIKEQLVSTAKVLVHRRTLILIPYYLYIGIYYTFTYNVLPTTILFTKNLSLYRYLPAYYSMAIAVGIISMSIASIFLSKRMQNFGLRPTYLIFIFTHATVFLIALFTIPAWSTVRQNDEPALLLQPSLLSILLIGFLLGVGDAASSTTRTVITSLVLPKHKTETFATSRLFHAMAASILLFTSSYLSVYHFIAILFLFLVAGSVGFWIASGKVLQVHDAPKEEILSDQ